ncbi:hypothetical protein BY996DRAFT_6509171 [Phakopsora pachyrhizi]|uniref:Uncharacterized protein n=1 Tax=Phakopsora pachyrhizi TaxID=170000 RepID=A0AAV0BML4_PHAPC|nr:hypothetical protein BY996DRAFT_6509171 [Phakopsora pachyrhizi]CAH7688545.1 hypothetical protein PPACK8108_LOCUS23512 [Phakopsora pachyrhizi]
MKRFKELSRSKGEVEEDLRIRDLKYSIDHINCLINVLVKSRFRYLIKKVQDEKSSGPDSHNSYHPAPKNISNSALNTSDYSLSSQSVIAYPTNHYIHLLVFLSSML